MLILILTLNEPLKVLNIVDYMISDYENALKDNNEYQEMIEFSQNLIELSDSSIIEYSKALHELIKKKADVKEVKELLLKIREIVLNNPSLNIYPKNEISLKAGREIYLYNCSVCHGDKGDGNGPASSKLEPKPINFLERDDLSAFRIWVVLNVGLVNMPSFNNLSDEDKWNVAFYVLSLKHRDRKVKRVDDTISLALISKLSDYELKERGYSDEEIAYIRTNIENFVNKRDNFRAILTNLELIKSLYNKGEYEKAYSLSLDLYFVNFEPIEKKLFAKDFSFASQLEQKFIQLRGLLKQKDKEKEIDNLISSIKQDLEKARTIIEGGIFSRGWAFFNSFMIIFREGLEAAILIGIILAVVSLSQNKMAIYLVHFGWISAILLGFLTWFISVFIINISTLSRELIEGIVGILAAIVLFHVSYWLISKAESKVWIGYIKEKLKTSINKGNLIFIFFLSFLAVYREAFETVLFYQAMLMNTPKTSISYIFLGFIIGSILILLIAYAIIKLQMRLPLNLIFPITGSALYLLSFIFTGQAIRSFQEANIIPTTSLNIIPPIDFLGIYPTLETLLAQSIFIILVVFALIIIRNEKKKREKLISEIEIAEREILNILENINNAKDRICKFQNLIVNFSEVPEKLNIALLHLQNLENALKEVHQEIKKNN
ncbi:MAG: FTR1 family protein [candidate division WOR-3 bacterium]